MLLQIEKLTKKFGDFPAISKLNFSVKSGEIFGIAGPNGAGKTTLFNVITGILPSSSGEIIFSDKSTSGSSSTIIIFLAI